jgi:tripartite-type tricarboxylate transporter receptor subunit TctC
VLAGRVAVMFDPVPAIRAHVKSGALRGLAVTTLKPDDVRARLIGAGIEFQSGMPDHFGNVIKAEVDKWGRIVKEAGIQPE